MPAHTPIIPVRDDIGHNGEPPPPPTGGGDDGRSGQGPNYSARLRRARLGLVCAMIAVSMLFVSLTGVFIFRKGVVDTENLTHAHLNTWGFVHLPWALLAINTVILLISSLTMELARRDLARKSILAPLQSIPGISLGEDGRFPWLGVTVALGFAFLFGQWMAWKQLEHGGFYLNTNPYSSFVYLLTATHAVHLLGGIVALLSAEVAAIRKRPIEARRIIVEITSWYWHFMALLWIYVFVLLAMGR